MPDQRRARLVAKTIRDLERRAGGRALAPTPTAPPEDDDECQILLAEKSSIDGFSQDHAAALLSVGKRWIVEFCGNCGGPGDGSELAGNTSIEAVSKGSAAAGVERARNEYAASEVLQATQGACG